MKITEKDIEKIKIYDRLEIDDENHYSWVLKLDQNFIIVSYGKVNDPLECDLLPLTSNVLDKLNALLERAKLEFLRLINSSRYEHRLYAN